jgi:hypothetical protein
LLAAPVLSPCARLLVIAPQPAMLAQWLAGFSFDVLVASEDPDAVLHGRRTLPRVDFLRFRRAPRSSLPSQTFDVAFLLPMPGHTANWLSLEARQYTAAAAAAVKPNGRIISWRDVRADGHSDDCWERHLGCFPGRVDAQWAAKPLLGGATTRMRLTIWQLPVEELSPADWQSYAERGLLTGRRGCCAAAHAAALQRAA